MANTIPDPIVLPDINLALPAEPIRADEVAKLLGCLNVANAYVGSGMVIQGSWHTMPTAALDVVNDGGVGVIHRYQVTLPTAYHTALRVRVRGQATDVGDLLDTATVIAVSLYGSDMVSAALPESPDDDWVTVGTLEVANGPSGFEEIRFGIDTTGEASGRILQVACEILPLSDPLPAATISGAVPFGLDNIVPDRPLPAPLGHKIIETIEAILMRPQHLMVWTGLDAFDPALYEWVWWSSLGHESYAPVHPRKVRIRAPSQRWEDDEGDIDGGASVRLGGAVLAMERLAATTVDGIKQTIGAIETGHDDPLAVIHPEVIVTDDDDGRLTEETALRSISIWTVGS